MKVSVIIPTLNAAGMIGRLIDSLRSQTQPPAEIIVMDSSSVDGTADAAIERGAIVRSISRGHFGHGKTRNEGASVASGDVIMFMVQDAVPADDGVIEALLRPISAGDASASYARQVPRDNATPVERFLRRFNYPDSGEIKGLADTARLGIKTFFMSNVCSAVRKEAFDEAGGFPDVISNEDMLLAAALMRLGHRVAYVPEAMVVHSHDYSPLGQMKRYFDIGVSLRDNGWILKNASSEPEGGRFLREGTMFLASSGKVHWVPYLFLEAAMKYAGYRMGLGYRLLPGWLVKRLSLSSPGL